MIDVWEKYGKANISAVRVPKEAVSKYGIAETKDIAPGIFQINQIVEKPPVNKAPSTLATHGAYIMPPRLFEILAQTKTGKDGELWLVDAINQLAKEEDVYAVEIKNGQYYDTGNKLEYLKAVVEFGLKHKELKDDFAEYLKHLKV